MHQRGDSGLALASPGGIARAEGYLPPVRLQPLHLPRLAVDDELAALGQFQHRRRAHRSPFPAWTRLRSPSGAARSMPRRRCQIRCRACARAIAGTPACPTSSPNRTGPCLAAASRTALQAERVRQRPALRRDRVKRRLHLRPPARRHDVPPAAGQRRLGGGREPDLVLSLDPLLRAHVDEPDPGLRHREEIGRMLTWSAGRGESQPERLRQQILQAASEVQG